VIALVSVTPFEGASGGLCRCVRRRWGGGRVGGDRDDDAVVGIRVDGAVAGLLTVVTRHTEVVDL
jgi:hypothetical protein